MATEDMEILVENMMKTMKATTPKFDELNYNPEFVVARHMKGRAQSMRNIKGIHEKSTLFTTSMDESPNSLMPPVDLVPENQVKLREIVDKGAAIWEGKFLVCRSLAPSWRINALFIVVDDADGNVAVDVMVYNSATDNIFVDTKLVIMNPYFKLTKAGYYSIRCDNPAAHLTIVDDESHPVLTGVTWKGKLPFPSEISISDTLDLNKAGIEFFKMGCYEKAFRLFSKALENEQSPAKILHLLVNRSATSIAMTKPEIALEDAERGLSLDPQSTKLQFRKATALFDLGKYKECKEFLASTPKTDPANELRKDSMRAIEESSSGRYDYELMWLQAQKNQRLTRHANYFASHIVGVAQVEGYGRGLVATTDIPPNTLILAEKAFAFDDEDATQNCTFNLEVDKKRAIVNISKVLAEMCEKVRKDPKIGAVLYKLSAGSDLGFLELSEAEACQKPVDAVRLKEIIIVNSFGAEGSQSEKARGVWITPSYINHSCVDVNLTRHFIGDFMFVRTIQKIPKGTQLLFQYGPISSFEQRDFSLRIVRGFSCKCRLCQMERSEPAATREQLNKIEASLSTIMVKYSKQGSDPVEKLEKLLAKCSQLRQSQDQSLNLTAIRIRKILGSVLITKKQLNKAAALISSAFDAFDQLGLVWDALDSAVGLLSCCKMARNVEMEQLWQTKVNYYADIFLGDHRLLPLHIAKMTEQ